uniref:Uncharacterized protein n=1 Tax=Vespula pensylvanica TaxID=30213 RepID=A0A834U472_VESPE|nr:hypothetical protein H0235_012344 [Vespula pensylvanica]
MFEKNKFVFDHNSNPSVGEPRHGKRIGKALVASSVGMATAPRVPASGRSILDDDDDDDDDVDDDDVDDVVEDEDDNDNDDDGNDGDDDGNDDDDDAQIQRGLKTTYTRH